MVDTFKMAKERPSVAEKYPLVLPTVGKQGPMSKPQVERRHAVETFMLEHPWPSLPDLHQYLEDAGLDPVSSQVLHRDIGIIRKRWGENPAIVEILGTCVRGLQIVARETLNNGEYSNYIGAVRQLDNLLHISQVHKPGVELDGPELLDLYTQFGRDIAKLASKVKPTTQEREDAERAHRDLGTLERG